MSATKNTAKKPDSKLAKKLKAEKAAKGVKKASRAAKKPQLSDDEIMLKAQQLQVARNQQGEARLKALISGQAAPQNDFQKSVILDYQKDAEEFTKLQQASKETQDHLGQIEGRLKELVTLRRKYLIDIQKWDKPSQ